MHKCIASLSAQTVLGKYSRRQLSTSTQGVVSWCHYHLSKTVWALKLLNCLSYCICAIGLSISVLKSTTHLNIFYSTHSYLLGPAHALIDWFHFALGRYTENNIQIAGQRCLSFGNQSKTMSICLVSICGIKNWWFCDFRALVWFPSA